MLRLDYAFMKIMPQASYYTFILIYSNISN